MKASKKQARLRLALIGPSGSGKTFSALRIARGLVGPGGRIAVADTERGSASKYADRFDFDAQDMEQFGPRDFIRVIQEAEREGYDALILDSLSHAWMGKGGALEMVDNVAKASKSRNSFDAWRTVTPEHNAMVDAILRARLHVIVTMRVKTEYVVEEVNGKKTPRKVGLAPVQRDGLEYEFDVVADMDTAELVVTKTRCPTLQRAVVSEPGEKLGETLKAWLTDGVPASAPARAEPVPPAAVTTFDKPTGTLSPASEAKAQTLASQLGGEVMPPKDVATVIVAEAEVVDSGEDFGRLAARAKALPKDSAGRKQAAAALQAAAKRLGITGNTSARQPGEEG
ncbi:hypothetical protein Mx8p81 [Myxococcus phage Mx8]|uniref:p81 n=1 Tax=Myxococcus phage Mx8 TaxID=49964 RepID=Q94MN8_9CAUD|nr:hypothetical protein Mx8p81 [Myxococcus phage Mx8]AAK94416.1 p81 [Myxococcus phage Mx8]